MAKCHILYYVLIYELFIVYAHRLVNHNIMLGSVVVCLEERTSVMMIVFQLTTKMRIYCYYWVCILLIELKLLSMATSDLVE